MKQINEKIDLYVEMRECTEALSDRYEDMLLRIQEIEEESVKESVELSKGGNLKSPLKRQMKRIGDEEDADVDKA